LFLRSLTYIIFENAGWIKSLPVVASINASFIYVIYSGIIGSIFYFKVREDGV
jgi:hypothetical protein